MIYSGIEPTEYEYSIAWDNGIPLIENGYYYFINRHTNAAGRDSDEDLFDVVSFNFSLALYDCDEDMFYYYELDT